MRPWNEANTQERNDGAYYRDYWAHALNTQPEIVSITSFNEWHEGSQIEAAVKRDNYLDYGADPHFYLKLTKEVSPRAVSTKATVDAATRGMTVVS